MRITTDTWVELPIGLHYKGVVYRRVRIDKATLLDVKIASNPQYKGNGARVLKGLLARCIQEIPGLLETKKKSTDMLPENTPWLNEMFMEDGVYLLTQRDFISKTFSEFIELADPVQCPNPRCREYSNHEVSLDHVPVFSTQSDDPTEFINEFDFAIPVTIGVGDSKKVCGKAKIRPIKIGEAATVFSNSTTSSSDQILNMAIACTKFIDDLGKEHYLNASENEADFLTSQQTEEIMLNFSELPGLKNMVELECPCCNEEFIHGVDLTSFFTDPKSEEKTVSSVLKRNTQKFKRT